MVVLFGLPRSIFKYFTIVFLLFLTFLRYLIVCFVIKIKDRMMKLFYLLDENPRENVIKGITYL